MSEQKKVINFIVACVNEFAWKYHISAKEAFQYLFQFKAIEFLKENYEAEHILSLENVIEDMALLFRQYENEMIDFETLLKGMIYKKTSSQYSFHTEKGIRLLRKVEN